MSTAGFSTSRITNSPLFIAKLEPPYQTCNAIQIQNKKSNHKSILKEASPVKVQNRIGNEKLFSNGDWPSSKGKTERSQSAAFKSYGLQMEVNQGVISDLKEQEVLDLHQPLPFHVESGNLQDETFLNAVVKVYCTHSEPDYSLPWQKRSNSLVLEGSAFMIGDGKLLTNAHCVEHDTQVNVKRRGGDTRYVAKVLARGLECDIALLSVENKEFWEGAEPLRLGRLPHLQDTVTIVGYPLGGDTISVTKGVVSRIEAERLRHLLSSIINSYLRSTHSLIPSGNSGGPAFNDQGEFIGVMFQVYRSDDVENIGYVIPAMVVSHFLEDYEKNGRYTGFPCLGVELQNLVNSALRTRLQVPSSEVLQGVLIRKIEPTSDAYLVLKEGDVIVSFDGVRVGFRRTVPFRTNERIAFRYLISQKFAGDVAELGIIRSGESKKVQVVLNPPVNLVPYHIEGDSPSYLIVAGMVFTPLSKPYIEAEQAEDNFFRLLAKVYYSMARFEGEQIVLLSQVLENDVNLGYSYISNEQVLKFNGKYIKNIHHLAHLVDSCKHKYLEFELEGNYLVVLEREAAMAASPDILQDFGIPSERSSDLSVPYAEVTDEN